MRALVLVGLVCSGCAERPFFVDQVEDGRARIIDADGRAQSIDARALPPDAGEGAWVGGTPPEFAHLAELRARLAKGDDGRDLVLGP